MISTWVFLYLAQATGTPEAEPAPVPSGMDLLYSDRVPFAPSGEPLIAIGLMAGQKRVVLRSLSAIRADFYEAGVLKRTTVRPNDTLAVTVMRAKPAARRTYVDLQGIGWGKRDKLDWAIAGWRARGYPGVEALEQGNVLGIGGRVLANREYRLVLPVASKLRAEELVAEVYDLFGTRAFISQRIAQRPWGELSVHVADAPVGTATSFVRLSTQGDCIEVENVEYGHGYSWHGFKNRQYRGELYVVIDPDGQLAAVNLLGAESLLPSVVPSEMFASSPPEALKAQAVAARNQLFAKLGKRHHADPYHLCSEQHCQVYSGLTQEDPRATAAVNATSGEILFHDEALVDTVYSSTCGGHTEDNDAVWGNDPDPALRARPDFESSSREPHGIPADRLQAWLESTPSTYCSRATKVTADKFRWQKAFSTVELQKIVDTHYPKTGVVRSVEIEERGRGGRAIGLTIIGEKSVATVVHELPIRKLFGNLNSGMFVINESRDDADKLTGVTFVGGGWGHGVGMCQLGAIGRAEAGHSYHDILSHYYNGSRVSRLYDTQLKTLPQNH